MEEVLPGLGQVDFVYEPLLFFGHEMPEFSWPVESQVELAEKQAEAEQEIADMIDDHKEKILEHYYDPAKPEPASMWEVEEDIKGARYHARFHVSHRVYERRMRGRFPAVEVRERHPAAAKVLNELEQQHYRKHESIFSSKIGPLEVETPDFDYEPYTADICAMFNEALAESDWCAVMETATLWHKALPEDSPSRQAAASYIGFAGNLILTEYCKTALALAQSTLPDGEFVSMKHFITVCWPTAEHLEQFIPEEVASRKQFLREIFLEYALRSIGGLRSYVEILAPYEERRAANLDERIALEDRYMTKLMDMSGASPERRALLTERIWPAVQNLRDNHKYFDAIELLDLGRRALDLPKDKVQQLIDEIAVDGMDHFTSNMADFDVQFVEVVGRHEYATCKRYQADGLFRSSGVSPEAYERMHSILQVREFERLTQQHADAPDEQKTEALAGLIDKIAALPKVMVERIANPDLADEVVQYFCNPTIALLSPSTLDSEVVLKVAQLRGKGLLDAEQQSMIYSSVLDNLLERVQSDPKYQAPFERLIGFISPIMRISKPVDDPSQEGIWRIMSPDYFARYMDAVATVDRNPEWIQEQKTAFLADVRTAWQTYWDKVQEYGW